MLSSFFRPRMSLHEVPHYPQPLGPTQWPEWVSMAVVTLALDHLIIAITSGPQLTHPALLPVHGGGVGDWTGLTVHLSCDLLQVIKLLMVVKAVDRESCIVGTLYKCLSVSLVTSDMTFTWTSISRGIWGHGDDAVLEAVEVNDADGELWHGVKAPERSAAHGAH